jgi:hypothetical protein
VPSFVRAVSASSSCSVTERHTVHHVPPRVLTYSLCPVTLFAAYPSSLPPHSPRFLRLSAYVPHRCVPFIQVFFSSLLCLWLCSASQMAGHYCVATFCVSGHIPINYPVCVDPIWTCVCLTLLRVIRYVSCICLKDFRPFSLYISHCVWSYFLRFCPSLLCCPFDVERFAVFCYLCESFYVFAETDKP